MLRTGQQAIAGISGLREAHLETIYPSIACLGIGRWLDQLYESVPVMLGTVKLSYLLFILPSAPIAAGLYFYLKIMGERYQFTSQSVRRLRSLGQTVLQEVALADVDRIEIPAESRTGFLRTGTLELRAVDGRVLMSLPGVPYPERAQHVLEEAMAASRQTQAALTTIRARNAG